MAQSINPAGYIEPGVIDNHVQVAAERGFSVEEWADHVEPESEHLAAALREHAAVERARAAHRDTDPPKARKSAADQQTTEGK